VTAHTPNCWRWHHQCGVARIHDLAAALTGALGAFNQVDTGDDGDVFTATVPAAQLNVWHLALDPTGLADLGVAGADVTPDPAAPATTTDP